MVVLSAFLVLVACSGGAPTADVKPDGKAIFNGLAKGGCVTCHTVTDRTMMGPGLAGVGKRYSSAWLKKWIADPQKVWDENDAETLAMKASIGADKRRYAGMKLLYPLTDAEMDALIEYLNTL